MNRKIKLKEKQKKEKKKYKKKEWMLDDQHSIDMLLRGVIIII